MTIRLPALALSIMIVAGCAGGARPETAMTAMSSTGQSVALEQLTTAYDVGGVRVIQRSNHANDVVAVNLYLLGGTRQLTARTAGIEPLYLAASEFGTEHYPKAEARRARAHTGSRIVIEPGVDWTVFGFRGVKQDFDSTWAIFADRLMHPSLDASDVSLVRSQLVGEARARRNTPDELVQMLADSAAFSRHPYGLEPTGTEQSLAGLSADDLQRYVAGQLVTSRMLLVVVGDVPRPQVETLVAATLATLPKGTYAWTMPPVIQPAGTSLTIAHRMLPTNYILGYFNGPLATSADYPAFRVATALLSAQLNSVIREENSLSYAAYAPFLERAAPAGGLYVTTVAPDRVLPLMQTEVRRLQSDRDWLSAPALRQFVEQFITDYFAENETNAAQADFLARAQLYRGDYRTASRFMEDIRRVSPADVRRVSQQYMRNIQFAYLGDSTRIARAQIKGFE